jgi:integrase/recombinase XerC
MNGIVIIKNRLNLEGDEIMCYKDEDQKRDGIKLNDKIKDMNLFIKEYFKYIKSNKTKLNNWCIIRKFFEWNIEKEIINNTLEEITPNDLINVKSTDITDYLNELLDENTIETVNTKMNVISGFWTYLVDNDYINKNIVTKEVSSIFEIEEKNKFVIVPTDGEIDNLINNIYNIKNEFVVIRNVAIVKLFIGTGIRIAELVGLDMDDLHFDCENPYISIMPKGKKHTKRNVPINKSAIDAVNSYIKIRNINESLKNLKPLFLSEKNNKETGLRNRLAKTSIQAFISECSNKKIHPHMLRDYAAKKMQEYGCALEVISEVLGHKDINTTRRHYVNVDMSPAYSALNSF